MKILKIFGIGIGCLIALGFIGLMIVGSLAPETYVYSGNQVPRKYLKKINELGLLEKEEQIIYFYTDAMFDIKDGLYFVTDKHLVLYSKHWEEPETIIGFEEITNIDVEYNESFLEDTYVIVETVSELEVHFPVSSELGRDKKFVQHIKSKMKGVDKDGAHQSTNGFEQESE